MDCLVHFCCETCALCQEYRELKNRGYDLSIGTLFFLHILQYTKLDLDLLSNVSGFEMRKHSWNESFHVAHCCSRLSQTPQ